MDRRLTVLFDADCAMCCRARGWLLRQRQLVPLAFLPAGSPRARERFPDLDHPDTLRLLHVVDERGDVYRGAKAWLMCLWALEAYRVWAVRLSRKGSLARAERFVDWASSRRHALWGKPDAC